MTGDMIHFLETLEDSFSCATPILCPVWTLYFRSPHTNQNERKRKKKVMMVVVVKKEKEEQEEEEQEGRKATVPFSDMGGLFHTHYFCIWCSISLRQAPKLL